MKTKSTRGIAFRKRDDTDVALGSPTVKEGLPYPYVHYPEHYGTFISFSQTPDSPHFFCSCTQTAVLNALHLMGCIDKNMIVKSSWGFHHHFSQHFYDATAKGVQFADVFRFSDKLCHRCNFSRPGIRWCHEMYGSNFKQYFGWYIKQHSFRLGFDGVKYLIDSCPEVIIAKLSEIEHIKTLELDPYDERYTNYYIVIKELQREIENQTRQEFGFRKIGDSWINETLMYDSIKAIFPNLNIIRHFRPDWLKGLELDVYIPVLHTAFEYQGQQHFYAIEAWGGKKALDKLKARDQIKRKLCENYKIRLIEVDYTESLDVENIRRKLKEVNINNDFNHDDRL